MTPKDFMTQVVDAYARARAPLWEHPKVRRSECRSISSEVEDLLAFYLASRLPSIEQVFINQTLIAPGQPRFKPELVICRRAQIGALLDVKIDLGWKRDRFETMLRETDTRMTQLRGQVCSFLAKHDGGSERMRLPVSRSAKYFVVILSDCNITSELCGSLEKCAKDLHNTEFLILTRGLHPNQPHLPKEAVLERIEICKDSFKKMEEDIKRVLTSI